MIKVGHVELSKALDARPTLDRLHDYPLTIREQVLPNSEAVRRSLLHTEELDGADALIFRGDLSMDNTERKVLAEFPVGRNNWTFLGSDNGGRTRLYCAASSPHANSSRSIRLPGS